MLEREDGAPDGGEVFFGLGEIIVEKVVEEVGHRAPSTARSMTPRASARSDCGVKGFVK